MKKKHYQMQTQTVFRTQCSVKLIQERRMQQNRSCTKCRTGVGGFVLYSAGSKDSPGSEQRNDNIIAYSLEKNIINRMKSGNWKALRNTKESVQDTVSHRQSVNEYCNILNRNQGLNQSSREQFKKVNKSG